MAHITCSCQATKELGQSIYMSTGMRSMIQVPPRRVRSTEGALQYGPTWFLASVWFSRVMIIGKGLALKPLSRMAWMQICREWGAGEGALVEATARVT